MKSGVRRASTAVLAVTLASGPVPTCGWADDAVAKVKKVTDPASDPKKPKELDYPTSLVQLVTASNQTNVSKDMSIRFGDAVLSQAANTALDVGKDVDACLFSNTFVRFDSVNVWLLRQGAVFVVTKRGKLEIVAEALGRVLINSSVYLRSDGSELLAFVTEGHVVLEAGARTLSLGPGQAGRIPMGEPPEETSLSPEDSAQISRDVETAGRLMKGGGGGGGILAAAIAAGLVGAAVVATRGGNDGGGKGGGGSSRPPDGGRGGSPGMPDLVPDVSKGGCRLDGSGNVILTVRNQGTAPSTTRLDFDQPLQRGRLSRRDPSRDTTQRLDTPAVRAGASAQVRFPSTLVQGTRLRVTVDADGRVSEANEGNNTAFISCPAPNVE
jgi:hypothetical protein